MYFSMNIFVHSSDKTINDSGRGRDSLILVKKLFGREDFDCKKKQKAMQKLKLITPPTK